MPKDIGYGKGKSQFYPGSSDPKNEYAQEDKDFAPVKGTHPNPRPSAAGKTGLTHNDPEFGKGSTY